MAMVLMVINEEKTKEYSWNFCCVGVLMFAAEVTTGQLLDELK